MYSKLCESLLYMGFSLFMMNEDESKYFIKSKKKVTGNLWGKSYERKNSDYSIGMDSFVI